jgi:RNA polymerase sigma factor (sigma-70 family)
LVQAGSQEGFSMSDGPNRGPEYGNATERREWVLAALEQYEGRLVRYALRLVGDLDLARDAVQHAFLKLCDDKVAGTLRVPSPPSGANGTRSVPATNNRVAAWLYRVCRNRALDHLRQAGRERPAEQAAGTIGREADPASAAEDAEQAELLRRLIGRLPTSQREAIDLWAEGFVYADIARIIDRHEGHVRVLVHRGLKALREQVGSTGSVEPRTASGASTC